MGRYIERAENIAGALSANLKFLRDSETYEASDTSASWFPFMDSLGIRDIYDAENSDSGISPLDFLIKGETNSDSLVNCVAQGRENARMVRDQISERMWIEVNSVYLQMKRLMDGTVRLKAYELFELVIKFSLNFQGITQSTLTRDEGYCFYQLGKYLERADKTTRILDLPSYGGDVRGQNEWSEVLNACNGRGGYISIYGMTVDERSVTSFLLFAEDFPRSVRFCVAQIDMLLRQLTGTSPGQRYGNEAQRLAGRALADIDFDGARERKKMGTQGYVDYLQTIFNEIGQQIFEIYFLIKIDDSTEISSPKVLPAGSLAQ